MAEPGRGVGGGIDSERGGIGESHRESADVRGHRPHQPSPRSPTFAGDEVFQRAVGSPKRARRTLRGTDLPKCRRPLPPGLSPLGRKPPDTRSVPSTHGAATQSRPSMCLTHSTYVC